MNEAICEAIRRRELVRFTYEGRERVVQPHLYGWNAESRREILSGFQVGGESGSSALPAWRTFYSARIRDLSVLPGRFRPREDFNPEDPVISVLYYAVVAA